MLTAELHDALSKVAAGITLTERARVALKSAPNGEIPFGSPELPGFSGFGFRELCAFALARSDRDETLRRHIANWARGASRPAEADVETVLTRIVALPGAPSAEIRNAIDAGTNAGWEVVATLLARKWNGRAPTGAPVSKRRPDEDFAIAKLRENGVNPIALGQEDAEVLAQRVASISGRPERDILSMLELPGGSDWHAVAQAFMRRRREALKALAKKAA